jgi:Mrp family chromosome partitioning ATPase
LPTWDWPWPRQEQGCLIDSDLRQPSLHDLSACQWHRLTVALADAKSVDRVVVPTTMPNLYLLVVPFHPIRGASGFQSMREFVENLAGQFDTLLFDSAPVCP